MFGKVLTALVLAIPLSQPALAGKCMRQYTIQEGDICDSISAAHNVSTYQLATINSGFVNSGCTNLQIGSTICLGYENEDCSTTYVVQANDTCEEITHGAGVNSTILYLNNPNINEDCSNIYIGEVLCTSPTVQVPPSSGSSVAATTIPPSATPAQATHTSSDNGDNGNDGDDGDDDDLPYCDEL